MNTNTNTKKSLWLILMAIWVINCILMAAIAIREIWIPSMNAAPKVYQNIKADPFNGTSLPITHIPDWRKPALRDKSLDFRAIDTKNIIPIPAYDMVALQDQNNLLGRFTYTVAYMGSYSLNYKENDGSHLGVDIRSPIGTPVLSIANGVVVRAVEADATGNKFVVIRHENVPLNGKTTDVYSSYLHLSEITVKEGTKIRKGEMLGRVGITGITTTPHLHFQIDTEDAPFHPYWPFSTADAQKAGMTIFQWVSAGLGAENALKYTINPMTFVKNYLGGANSPSFTENDSKAVIPMKTLEEIIKFSEPEVESAPPAKSLEDIVRFQEVNDKTETMTVASSIAYNPNCVSTINTSSATDFGKNLASLQSKNCAFNDISPISATATLTRAEALTILMQYHKMAPESGNSHFLDISLADQKLQGLALKASQNNIVRGSYFYPERTISRGEFIEFLSRFGALQSAPANYTAYSDVPKSSTLFNSINNYGFTIGVRNVRFSPNAPLTQAEAVTILNSLVK